MKNTRYDFEKEYTKKDPWNYNNSLKDCVRRNIYVTQLEKAFDRIKVDRVFDAGCGEGYLTKDLINHYPDVQVDATDISQNGIGIAKEINYDKQINYFAADLTKCEIAANTYELIICTEVFLYFTENEIDETINKFYSALKEGGVLIISLMTDYKRKDEGKIDIRKISVSEISDALTNNNFDVVNVIPSLILDKKILDKIIFKISSILFSYVKSKSLINYLRKITLSYPLDNCHKISVLAVKSMK